MKLLPPREVETHTNAQKTTEIQRITAIRSQLSREELHLNEWNDAIDEKKSKAIKDFDDKVMVLNRTVNDLKEEITVLEEKREKLLRPLDADPAEIMNKLAATEDMLNYLQDRKKELAVEKKKLESLKKEEEKQLSVLLNRENTLDRRELNIAERSEAVKSQEVMLAQSTERLTDESNRKNIELLLFEGILSKKEVELAEREKLIAEANEKIVRDRKRIESQQQSLIAALQEIKNNT